MLWRLPRLVSVKTFNSRCSPRLPHGTPLACAFVVLAIVILTDHAHAGTPKANLNKLADQQSSSASEQPYPERPLRELVKQIHDLRGIHPATDQHELSMILRNTGATVDEFFANLVDLEAHEEIKQDRLSGFGASGAHQLVRDSYIILRHGTPAHGTFDEFRMDEYGNRLDNPGAHPGFLVTAGFALICMNLSTEYQSESTFRYLGDQIVAGKPSYVLAFAQQPAEATLTITMIGPGGAIEHLLTQGIVWVNRQNFHILRMRIDLLRRQPEIGLDQQTTKVDFSEIQLADLPAPLWLPREVTVYLKIGRFGTHHFEESFRNIHHYSDYQRFRVSTKMLSPQ